MSTHACNVFKAATGLWPHNGIQEKKIDPELIQIDCGSQNIPAQSLFPGLWLTFHVPHWLSTDGGLSCRI
jgi:hypothetical protein